MERVRARALRVHVRRRLQRIRGGDPLLLRVPRATSSGRLPGTEHRVLIAIADASQRTPSHSIAHATYRLACLSTGAVGVEHAPRPRRGRRRARALIEHFFVLKFVCHCAHVDCRVHQMLALLRLGQETHRDRERVGTIVMAMTLRPAPSKRE